MTNTNWTYENYLEHAISKISDINTNHKVDCITICDDYIQDFLIAYHVINELLNRYPSIASSLKDKFEEGSGYE